MTQAISHCIQTRQRIGLCRVCILRHSGNYTSMAPYSRMGIIILPVRNGGVIMEISPEKKKALMVLIGNNVRQCRVKRGLTQEELANQIDVDTSTIARIEGGTRMMSIIILCAMAEALQVSYDTLLRSNDAD